MDVNVARTAIGLSGVVNGIGTVAFTLFVDPTSSIIIDQAVKGERPVEEVNAMVFYLSVTAIVGSLLSQLILWPAAVIIKVVARFGAHVDLQGRARLAVALAARCACRLRRLDRAVDRERRACTRATSR